MPDSRTEVESAERITRPALTALVRDEERASLPGVVPRAIDPSARSVHETLADLEEAAPVFELDPATDELPARQPVLRPLSKTEAPTDRSGNP